MSNYFEAQAIQGHPGHVLKEQNVRENACSIEIEWGNGKLHIVQRDLSGSVIGRPSVFPRGVVTAQFSYYDSEHWEAQCNAAGLVVKLFRRHIDDIASLSRSSDWTTDGRGGR